MAKTKVITTAWDNLPTNNQKNLENMFSQLSPAQKQRLINTINDVKAGSYTWEQVDAVLNPKNVRDPIPAEVATALKDAMKNSQWERLTQLYNGPTPTTLDTAAGLERNNLLDGNNKKSNIFDVIKGAIIGHGKDVLDTENVYDEPEVTDVSKQGFKAQEKALEQQAKVDAAEAKRKEALGTAYNFGGRLQNYNDNAIFQQLAQIYGWSPELQKALYESSINDTAAYTDLYNDPRAQKFVIKLQNNSMGVHGDTYQQTVDNLQDCASYLDRLLHEIGKSFNDYVDRRTNVVDLYQLEYDLMNTPDSNKGSLSQAKAAGYVTKAIDFYSKASNYLTVGYSDTGKTFNSFQNAGSLVDQKEALDQQTLTDIQTNEKLTQNLQTIKRLLSVFLNVVEYKQTAKMNTPKDVYDSVSKYLSSTSNQYDRTYNDMVIQEQDLANRISQMYESLNDKERSKLVEYLSLLQQTYPVYRNELSAIKELLDLESNAKNADPSLVKQRENVTAR